MNRLLIWPAIFLLPLSLYGVMHLWPSLESVGKALVWAVILDALLVLGFALVFRRKLKVFDDSTLVLILSVVYLAVPSLWVVLEMNQAVALESRVQRYEVLDRKVANGSADAYLFLWTGDGIRRHEVHEEGQGWGAVPGDTLFIKYKTGLLGLETISDVDIQE